MEPLPVDIFQLQRRDPAAWSALLARGAGEAIVTAVTAEPLCRPAAAPPGRAVGGARRYVLTLADCSDPITFIAKQTNETEAALYRRYGDPPGAALPACRYVHLDGDDSWVVLDDVPDHFPPAVWTPAQADAAAATLARFHAAHWNQDARAEWDEPPIPHFLHRPAGPYRWDEVRRLSPTLADEGPQAVLSRHAVRQAERLAPRLARAAEGLLALRRWGGWPGVINGGHLAAVADLLDDPLPMLATLRELPTTLLHGAPHPRHWRLSLFDECVLIDWSEAQIGPGVLDLAAFLEGYPLVYDRPAGDCAPGAAQLRLRPLTPLLEETLVDTYLITLSAELGGRAAARSTRAALPAARCLFVLLTWLPFLADWAAETPDGLGILAVSASADATAFSAYLSAAFDRFLRAYRAL